MAISASKLALAMVLADAAFGAADPASGNRSRLRGASPKPANTTEFGFQSHGDDKFGASADIISCGNELKCGGDSDLYNQMSCTPFPVKRDDAGGQCTIHDGALDGTTLWWDEKTNGFAGGQVGAKAWGDGGNDNFWIFHGCDGAGLQPDDCQGDSYYLESFGQECTWGVDCWCDVESTDLHNECPFIHPGTGKAYSWYHCGWFSTSEQWPDQGKNWWKNTGLGWDTGAAWPNANAVLYPWVCHKNTGDDRTYFGSAMGFDSMTGWNCYCDNEQANSIWDGSEGPKSMWAYQFAWRNKQLEGHAMWGDTTPFTIFEYPDGPAW